MPLLFNLLQEKLFPAISFQVNMHVYCVLRYSVLC